MKIPRWPEVDCAAAAVCAAFWLLSMIPAALAQDQMAVIGSSNTVTADPPVTRPHETPCIVPLFVGFQFVNFNIQSFAFAPPENCPGPWEKIVFTADFNVTAGRQFDRTAIVDLGYVNIYFGTRRNPEVTCRRRGTWNAMRPTSPRCSAARRRAMSFWATS